MTLWSLHHLTVRAFVAPHPLPLLDTLSGKCTKVPSVPAEDPLQELELLFSSSV